MSREHPILGVVDVMPRRLQPKKTWRHFYSPVEDWGSLAGVDPQRLYSAVRAWGCPEWTGGGRYPRFPGRCVAKLREHHDAHYGPVYMDELFAPGTRHARSLEDGRWVSLSERWVYVVIGDGEGAPVISAYRPHWQSLSVPPPLEHFKARALERWHKETGMSRSDLQARLERVVRDVDDAWVLAMAIAEARAADDGMGPALAQATQRLAACPAALRDALRPDPELLFGRLDDALKGEEPDVSGVLLELEEALTLLELLDGEAHAEDLRVAAEALLDWAPPEWSRLQRLCAQRVERSAGAAQGLWASLHAQLVAAALTEAEPVVAPRSTLAAALVQQQLVAVPTAPAALAELLDRAWQLAQRSTQQARTELERLLDGLTLRQPGILLASLSSEPAWVLRASALRAEGARVFAVDPEYPDGYEITEYLQGAEADVWRLERPGQEVVVVTLRGAPTSGSLKELLQGADSQGIEVALRRFTRPR